MSGTNSIDAVEATLVFAENIRDEMMRMGTNVSQVAREAGISRVGLSNLLNGKGGNCSIATAQRISEVIGVELWGLMKPRADRHHN